MPNPHPTRTEVADFEGVMPLARQLGELTGRAANCPARPLEELRPIAANVVHLNPRAWGFRTREEMEAAFNGAKAERDAERFNEGAMR